MRNAIVLAVLLGIGTSALAAAPTHYRIKAKLDPASHRIEVSGVIVPPGATEQPFRFTKTIDHKVAKESEGYARGFAETDGTIQPEGVFLSGSSKWYPAPAANALVTFSLEVRLPPGWDAMSQGKRSVHERGAAGTRVVYVTDQPQEEIWLIAGPWTETSRSVEGIEAQAFLRTPDAALAGKYLEATGPYVAMYQKLLGNYPYSKFALVENFWETGYGMPSFTLLGSAVMRLPFIVTTSYPHEILHNWWGNGVYVDPAGGNWSEGLTAYLADHLLAEQNGGGAAYRQETLQKYADYAAHGKDFPLSQFRERHSPSTEAVGYGKALMLFHMMRRELGDAKFIKALRALYAEKKFQRASFDDVRRSFETFSGRNLASVFDPWVTRTGAPHLKVVDVESVDDDDNGFAVTGKILQLQDGEPFEVAVPVVVTMEGREGVKQGNVRLTGKETKFYIPLSGAAIRVDVDPFFDVFRTLDVEEAPPALSGAFGDEQCTMVLPTSAAPELLAAYRAMATGWNTGRTSPMTIVNDDAIEALPKTGSIWIVGFENRFRAVADAALAPLGAKAEPEAARARVLVARRDPGAAPVIAFVAADHAAQVAGLARKLPHYHKYSFLAFEGDEPVNVQKGRWTVMDSPLTTFLSGTPAMGTPPPRDALATLPPVFSKERMLATVRDLASPQMKGRGYGTPELDKAAATIEAAMKDAGLELLPTDPQQHNVVGVLRGTKTEWATSSVVVGAHYDHLGTSADGTVHPGADDNASGVAVLLELARQMAANGKPSRTIVFAAFTGEESGLIGSKRYVAASSTWPGQKAIGMVNLDTVGRLSAGKILVLGSNTADEWIHIVNGAGVVTGSPVEAVLNDPGGSDQKSFTDVLVPAVQVFTGANADYHKPGDTPDKIDGDGLVKVAAVTREMVAYLAERPNPLTSKLAGAPTPAPSAEPSGRRVSMGTIPDYAYAGPGVRITGTTPGSPAERAGLIEGDVIVKIAGTDISTLKDFATALGSFPPGAKVTVIYQRDGASQKVEVTLVAR